MLLHRYVDTVTFPIEETWAYSLFQQQRTKYFPAPKEYQHFERMLHTIYIGFLSF
jgi:hypothetical protein